MRILSEVQEKVLHIFGSLPDASGFRLSGGTALSVMYLHHRRSNDLAFFTVEEELIAPLTNRLHKALLDAGLAVEKARAFRSFVELFVGPVNE